MERRNWTREELVLALNLYLKLEFGKMHSNNAEVVFLSRLIKRTPSAVAMRLVNFAAVDPFHKKRGVKGLSGDIKQVEPIWNQFIMNKEDFVFESEALRAKYEKRTVEDLIDLRDFDIKEGKEKLRLVKTRVNQSFFRSMILASYNFSCAISGIKNSDLLVASHIVPWSEDKENRLNPRNGICLNAFLDRAFDKYLITVTPDHKLMVSKRLKAEGKNKLVQENFLQFEGKEIKLPERFLPEETLLLNHNRKFNLNN